MFSFKGINEKGMNIADDVTSQSAIVSPSLRIFCWFLATVASTESARSSLYTNNEQLFHLGRQQIH